MKITSRTKLDLDNIKPELIVGMPIFWRGKKVGKCSSALYEPHDGIADIEYELKDEEAQEYFANNSRYLNINMKDRKIELTMPVAAPEPSLVNKPFKDAKIKIVLSLVYDFMQVPYVKSLMNLKKPGYANLDISRGPQIIAMNLAMKDFEDYDAILLTEWDHDFKPDALEKLWNMNVPVASAMFRSRKGPHPWLLMDESQPEDRRYVTPTSMTDPFRIDCTGLGFMLIRREVLDKIGRPIFKPFSKLYHNIDRELCRDIKKAGFDLMVNPQVRLGHYATERIY